MSTTMSVRFWGVRGSIPCPGPNTVRYGGNTSCVEVKCGDRRLVFDAGSGLRMLGLALADEPGPVDIDLFLSHCHIDHLIGLPFFVSAFVTGNRLRLWAGNLKAAGGVQETVRKLVSYPLFPIEIEAAQGKIEFNDFTPGDVLTPRPNINVMTTALNHPGGATGYRVEFGGRAMAYITDTELVPTLSIQRCLNSPVMLRLLSSIRHTPTKNCPSMSAGVIQAGSRLSGWPMRRAWGSFICFTMTPNTTTTKWTASRRRRPKRAPEPW